MRNLTEKEFNEKYELYKDIIYNIAYTYVHNKDDALDISQEVFIKYLNSDEIFDSLNNEKYWIIRVTINTCKNDVTSSSLVFTSRNICLTVSCISFANSSIGFSSLSNLIQIIFHLNYHPYLIFSKFSF